MVILINLENMHWKFIPKTIKYSMKVCKTETLQSLLQAFLMQKRASEKFIRNNKQFVL